MRVLVGAAERGPVVSTGIVLGSLALLTLTVVSGVAVLAIAPLVALVVVVAVAYRTMLTWQALIVGLVLVILFIPIKRYSMGGSLPFELEPYRLYVALVAVMWLAALLADQRVRVRASGLEAPIFLFAAAAAGSVIFNGDRVTELAVDAEVTKQLTFFASFVLVFYLIVSVVRTFEQVERLVRVLVGGAAVVSLFAIFESRTGYNIFDHLSTAVPLLQPETNVPGAEPITRGGNTRVFGSAQGPIALGAAFALLLPLGVYLGLRFRQVRWWIATALLALGALATLSRTSIFMLMLIVIVFLWLRPRQTKRFWPVLLPAVVVIQLMIPGTIGTLRASFFPSEGLIAQQSNNAGGRGSGRIADLGPALDEFSQTPLFGQGYGTRLTGRDRANAHILDDQWLKTLLETGLIGFSAWLWLFARSIRRLGRAAKEDQSDQAFLFVAFAAAVAAFAFGMLLYDAFSFIQVTFLLFILLALSSVTLTSRDRPARA